MPARKTIDHSTVEMLLPYLPSNGPTTCKVKISKTSPYFDELECKCERTLCGENHSRGTDVSPPRAHVGVRRTDLLRSGSRLNDFPRPKTPLHGWRRRPAAAIVLCVDLADFPPHSGHSARFLFMCSPPTAQLCTNIARGTGFTPA